MLKLLYAFDNNIPRNCEQGTKVQKLRRLKTVQA